MAPYLGWDVPTAAQHRKGFPNHQIAARLRTAHRTASSGGRRCHGSRERTRRTGALPPATPDIPGDVLIRGIAAVARHSISHWSLSQVKASLTRALDAGA